jgi:hypothetical protein
VKILSKYFTRISARRRRFGALQFGASGKYLFSRPLSFSYGAKAAKQGLRHLHAMAARPVVEAEILERRQVRCILIGFANRSVRFDAGTPVAPAVLIGLLTGQWPRRFVRELDRQAQPDINSSPTNPLPASWAVAAGNQQLDCAALSSQ